MWRSIAFAALTLCVGCETIDRPIGSSLTGMTFETQWHKGRVLEHSEMLSANGLSHVPDVGLYYHYSKGGWLGSEHMPPSTALGISSNHSFRLVGSIPETSIPSKEDVASAREQLIKIHNLITEAALLTTVVEQLRHLTTDPAEGDASLVQLAIHALPTVDTQSSPAQALDTAQKELVQVQQKIVDAREEMLRLTSKPGLIIARWRATKDESVNGSISPFASGNASKSEAKSGFVILAGLRLSVLFIGDDFKQMIARLDSTDREMFRHGSFSTYVLQARRIAWVTDLDLSAEGNLGIDARLGALQDFESLATEIDRIKLGLYAKYVADLSNSGVLDEFDWEVRPYCFVSGNDIHDVNELDNWKTVVSQQAHPHQFPSSALDRYQARYNEKEIPPSNSSRKPCETEWCDHFGAMIVRARRSDASDGHP